MINRLARVCLAVSFAATSLMTPRALGQPGLLGLPEPGVMVNLSPSYVPLMLTGLTVHPENPLLMDFIVTTGNSGLDAQQVREQSGRLIKYFLACLAVPEGDQWVNLSPYEKQRIVPDDLGKTVLGQDMLAEDYLLKQLTASLIYPERNLGKAFWDRVYERAGREYGDVQIPVNTFNKVWILPDTAKVYQHKDTVFVVKSHLKVMLDEDYLALRKHLKSGPMAGFAEGHGKPFHMGSQLVRQIIVPAIEQEVNNGKNFARMRQIYNSMILAVWFKKNLKQALLNQVYTDKAKTNGINVDDPAIKQKIYEQYLEAYRKGVFNYIKEESGADGQDIPRKYFSGGLATVNSKMVEPASLPERWYASKAMAAGGSKAYRLSAILQTLSNAAMSSEMERTKLKPALLALSLTAGLAGAGLLGLQQAFHKEAKIAQMTALMDSHEPYSTYYSVGPEKTLEELAHFFGVSVNDLINANKGLNPKAPLSPGQLLKLPSDIKFIEDIFELHGETLAQLKSKFFNRENDGRTIRVIFDGISYDYNRPLTGKQTLAFYVSVKEYERLRRKGLLNGQGYGDADRSALANVPKPTRSLPPGGIDLNAKNLDLQSEGGTVDAAFDPAMVARFRRGDLSGVQIKIFDVVPVNLRPLLGL